LLSDDIDDVVDVDILEKYRPSLQQLGIPFVLETEGDRSLLPGFSVSRRSQQDIRLFLQSVDRTLVFT
ncbi:MAG TPA: hypothetical protein VIU63_01510, partial [Nitrospira sp.]